MLAYSILGPWTDQTPPIRASKKKHHAKPSGFPNRVGLQTEVDAYKYASMRANTHFVRNQKPAKKENPKMLIEANAM